MDGLKSRGRVVVIAATNIPNAVDPALRRPGRFDRELEINAPNEKGRLEVLKIHTRNMPLKKVNLDKISSKMVGYTGADIEGVVREAAILALRENNEAKEVTTKHFDAALEEVTPSVTEDTVKYYAELGKKLRSRTRRKQKRSEDDLYM